MQQEYIINLAVLTVIDHVIGVSPTTAATFLRADLDCSLLA